MSTIIAGGTVVGLVGSQVTDLVIDGEKITSLGRAVPREGDTVIDATGCLVLPGGIDTHTHLDLETQGTVTSDDFATGTKAALAGGTTLVMDFATAQKGETLQQGLDNWHAKAAGTAWTDYVFHLAFLEWKDGRPEEIARIAEQGVTSFKLYMAYRPAMMLEDDELFRALTAIKAAGGTVGVHAENGRLIDELTAREIAAGHTSAYYHQHTHPVEVEREAIDRLGAISKLVGAAPCYVVHLSSAEGYAEISQARQAGVPMVAETCPQYLLLDAASYGTPDTPLDETSGYVISPPLRATANQEVLWRGLQEGTIQLIGTDHCPFNMHGQKDHRGNDFRFIPNGAPGIQLRMELLFTYGVAAGKLSLERYAEVNATNAAKYFGIYPRKGVLAPGSDADVVVYDPTSERTVRHADLLENVDYTPYEGWRIKGRVRDVLLRGAHVVRNGALEDSPSGEFVPCGPSQPLL